MVKPRIAIVGLGLIGGSLARRLVNAGCEVTAWNHNDRPYATAEADGIICKPTLAALAETKPNVLVLCNPLKAMPEILGALKPLIDTETTTLTDVGSVKGMVRDQVKAIGLDGCYVGAHPMAGNELSGWESSDPTLYDDALWAITVDEHTEYRRFRAVADMIVNRCGNRLIVLDDATHDRCAALISHMPHVIATAMINELVANPNKVVIVQTAPAVRAALGEEFGLPPGTLVTGKMVYALRELGFDYVFDTDFAADLTIMEEGAEILNRLTRYLQGDKSVRLPILTSCCPAWVNFFEHHFPDMLDIPSTARSPQQMFGSIAKTFWAKKMGIPREKLVVVSIMPCLAKKYECDREEFKTDGNPDVDYSISTRELTRLIRRANIGFTLLTDKEFDLPMGASTGAGVIFGTTGGVMEAVLRSVYEIYTGRTLDNVNFEQVRGLAGVRRATIDLDGFELKVGIAHGLGNARHLLEDIRNGHNEYHVIEIMACPGGCIGGGGQPLHHGNSDVLYARANALYREDANKPLRKSHENPYIKTLYEEYLGKPLSETAEHLLHTHYFNKSMD